MLISEEKEAFCPLTALGDECVPEDFTGVSSTREWVLAGRLVPWRRWAVTAEQDRLGWNLVASIRKEDRYKLIDHLLPCEVLGDEGESEVLLVDFDPLLLCIASFILVEDEVNLGIA